MTDGWAERSALLLEGVRRERTLTVELDRATLRRLSRTLLDYYAEFPDEDHGDPAGDEELEVALLTAADRGLKAHEDEAGVWADLSGWEHSLPRDRRSSLCLRARFAFEAAVRTWGAT